MKIKLVVISLLLFMSYFSSPLVAQKTHTDHLPSYRKWQDDYTLDKIEYTKSGTIFYFRFVCKSGKYTNAIFYPPGGEHPWYLKGRNVRKNFRLKAIKNVRRNGKLMKSTVRSVYSIPALEGKGYTVFSCEVHFERLPNDLTQVDLIEGKGQEYNKNHFNCFNIKLKTSKDKSLGKEKDSNKKLTEFEKKYNVNSRTARKKKPKKRKPKPKKTPKKPKPKPEPEPQPIIEEIKKPEPVPEPEPKPEIIPVPEDINPYSIPQLHEIGDITCGEKIVLDKLKFHDNSTKFKGMVEGNRTLHIIFLYMKEHPLAQLTLYGHSDVFGDKERNLDLSKARAVKVQRWLSMYGINPKRIDYKWFGGTQPVKPEGDAINRRIEIKLDCKKMKKIKN